MEFNINYDIKIKITSRGEDILRENGYSVPSKDSGDFSKMQLWSIMSIFGKYIYLGCEPPFETTIVIPQ